ncbi:MAG: hypothetical protein K0M40_03835 [Prolixibacteraceae bacterium]|nr:hypothetical protein [Prolixibacteraceae bacterium]
MKAVYCTPNFNTPLTTMELDRPMVMSDYLLERELKRLLEEVTEEEAIQLAMDHLLLGLRPIRKEELPAMIVQTEYVQSLLMETEGMMMEEADEMMQEEYQEKTYYSFLIELMNWVETR